ncbi:MAG: hypothetical protein MZW92_69755 [Comamonadaceae bacterium]|nr:hypothetical protein [Comamonadaceae bacterium]
MTHPLLDKHRATLDGALAAIADPRLLDALSRAGRARRSTARAPARPASRRSHALLGKQLRPRPARRRPAGLRRRPLAVRRRPRRAVPGVRPRGAGRRRAGSDAGLAEARRRRPHRRVPGDPRRG